MGVIVLVAGIAVFSVKIWTTLSRKKARKQLLLKGLIPGYIPLAAETIKVLSDNNVPRFLPEEDKSSSATDFFFLERNRILGKAIHFSSEYKELKLDYSEESLSRMERWLMEYRKHPPSAQNIPDRYRQTLSLCFDIAAYLEKSVTGYFPKERYLPRLLLTMDELMRAAPAIENRQTLLKLYKQYRDSAF